MLVLAVIFILIWLLQVLSYDKLYQMIKTNEVESVNNEISQYYDENNLEGILELSNSTGCTCIIFTVEESESGQYASITFSTARTTDLQRLGSALSEMLTKLGTDSIVEYTSESGGYTTLTYGQVKVINEENVYIYSNAIVSPTDSTVEVLSFTLVIITTVGLLVTLLLSIFLSKNISKPIMEISEQAKKLSNGNLDITFHASGFSEVQQLSDTLNYSIGEIKKGQDIQKEVIQNVSHELRTPLTVIKSYTELLQDYSGEDIQKRQEHLKIISEETKRLETLVNDMLDLSKMQMATMTYSDENYNLSESLAKFAKHYEREFTSKGYAFKFSYPKKVMINADKVRIEQVLTNLINNAINYSKEDKNITVRLFKIPNSKTYELDVIDKGMGISKQDQEKIFDRHFRSASSKRAVAGSGMGLAIVKQILEHYNFEYGVESELGKGSKFYIKFSA